MVYTQPRIYPGKWNVQTSPEFWDTNGSSNLSQTTRPYYYQQKKRTFRIVKFAVLADHREKLKESEKKDKYLDLAIELKKKKTWNLKVMIIPIVIGALVTVIKRLIQGQEDFKITGWVETNQTTALLRSARVLRRVLESWRDLLSLNL